jgi:hypothetical protein
LAQRKLCGQRRRVDRWTRSATSNLGPVDGVDDPTKKHAPSEPPSATCEADLVAAKKLAERRRISPKAIVCPRNQFTQAPLGVCGRHGVIHDRVNRPPTPSPRPSESENQVVRKERVGRGVPGKGKDSWLRAPSGHPTKVLSAAGSKSDRSHDFPSRRCQACWGIAWVRPQGGPVCLSGRGRQGI